MRNLSVIKGLYQGNGVTRRFAIPFEYNDTAQIFVTITTYDEGDYTYRVLDSTEYTIDEDSVEIVYPKTVDDEPIPSTQYLTVWRDTDLLQLMDLTNQGAAWPDSIEASLDKLHQIVQELAEGLSRSLKVDIGDPQTPDEKLVAIQDYVLAAAESSRSASASEANAQRSAEAAATSEANAAESERLASGYADTATAAASRAEDSAISARAYNAPDYDNETTYQAGDVVTYTDGNSYRALQETTGHEPPNIIYWQRVTDSVGDDFFEVDEYGYIVPMDSPSHSRYWRVDQNGYIVPIEGGDGGYRPDTRSLSAEYLNVTNEGYVKHLRADDIAAQEVDADEMTAEAAAFNTLTANAVNAGTVTANDIIAKGPIVDVRAFGAKGDGVTDDTAAFQAAIDNNPHCTITLPNGTYLISAPITVSSNKADKVNLNLGAAEIKASDNFPANSYMLDIGATGDGSWGSDGTTEPCRVYGGHLIGGTNTFGGVRVKNTSMVHLFDMYINNIAKEGVRIDPAKDNKSSDVYINTISITGTGADDSVGLIVTGYDNKISRVRTWLCQTGVKTTGGGNYYTEIHPLGWHIFTDTTMGVGFYDDSTDNQYHQCYSDGFDTAFKTGPNCAHAKSVDMYVLYATGRAGIFYSSYNAVCTAVFFRANVNFNSGQTNNIIINGDSTGSETLTTHVFNDCKFINAGYHRGNYGPLAKDPMILWSLVKDVDWNKIMCDTSISVSLSATDADAIRSSYHLPGDTGSALYGMLNIKSYPNGYGTQGSCVQTFITSNDCIIYKRATMFADAENATWSAWKKVTTD